MPTRKRDSSASGPVATEQGTRKMSGHLGARRWSICLVLLLQYLQARRRRLREERINRTGARLERFRRFFQRQRSERATFIMTLATALMTGTASPPIERRLAMLIRDREAYCQWWELNDMWTENDWLENIRMSKETFEFLCNELRESLRKETPQMRNPISVDKKVALAIWKIATNADDHAIESLFGVSKITILNTLREVCEAIVQTFMDRYISMPNIEIEEVVGSFEAKWGIPQCVGAVVATHIPVMAPPDNTFEYCNNKGWHSIMVQIVADSSYSIMDVHIANSGSLHDAELFASSNLFEQGQDGTLLPNNTRLVNDVEVPYFIVGDEAYPLLDWLMKPYPTGSIKVKDSKHILNDKLRDIHQTSVHAMTRLKGRWRCLQTQSVTMIDLVMLIVQACCILHNICEERKHTYNPDWMLEMKNDMPISSPLPEEEESKNAESIRRALVTYLARNV